jgi:sugar lactone lactonase YvrE
VQLNLRLDRGFLISFALGLAACNSDAADDAETDAGTETGTSPDPTATDSAADPTPTSTTDEPTTADPDTGDEPTAKLVSVWTIANPAGLGGDAVLRLTPMLDLSLASLAVEGDVVSIQSVAIGPDDDAVITFDAPGGLGGVIVDAGLADDPQDGALARGDRVIAGPATGLTAPKGVEFVGDEGLFVVADVGAGSIFAFMITDSGDVDPVFTVTDLGSSAAVWDVHYVDSDDVLYAAGTNGEVQVFAGFLQARGAGGPDRTIVPTSGGDKVSINLHGITVAADVLYLSDVGDAMNAEDGQLFTIRDVEDADGDTEVDQRILGGMLGNPVDLEVRPGLTDTLYVAEKSNDALLIYDTALLGSDLELTGSLAVTKPESVALVDGSDALILARNPAGLDMDAALRLTPQLLDEPSLTTLDRLGSVTSIQSVVISPAGDGFISFDGAASSGGGGVFAAPGLTVTTKGPLSATRTRLWGQNAGIVAPRGLAFDASRDRLFVADIGAGDIKVFDASATGDTAPLFVVTDLGGAPAWDIAYHAAGDRLFAAGTDGRVRVFDALLTTEGSDGPARVITPTRDDGDSSAVNLHGIHYDAASDTLLVSDIGDAMVDDDGFIFVIADAKAADGLVEAQAVLGGDATQLGNPVDLAFDGADLYIAEKANSAVLRYDGALGLRGRVDAPADAAIAVTNPESVHLVFESK